MHATRSIARGEVPKHCPRLHVRIEGWYKLGCTAIFLLPQRTREQSVEVVRKPQRVDAVDQCIQVSGSGQTLRRRAGDETEVHDSHTESGHRLSFRCEPGVSVF